VGSDPPPGPKKKPGVGIGLVQPTPTLGPAQALECSSSGSAMALAGMRPLCDQGRLGQWGAGNWYHRTWALKSFRRIKNVIMILEWVPDAAVLGHGPLAARGHRRAVRRPSRRETFWCHLPMKHTRTPIRTQNSKGVGSLLPKPHPQSSLIFLTNQPTNSPPLIDGFGKPKVRFGPCTPGQL